VDSLESLLLLDDVKQGIHAFRVACSLDGRKSRVDFNKKERASAVFVVVGRT